MVLLVDDDGSAVGVLAALLTVFAVLFFLVLAILVAMVTIIKCRRGEVPQMSMKEKCMYDYNMQQNLQMSAKTIILALIVVAWYVDSNCSNLCDDYIYSSCTVYPNPSYVYNIIIFHICVLSIVYCIYNYTDPPHNHNEASRNEGDGSEAKTKAITEPHLQYNPAAYCYIEMMNQQ